MSSIDRVNIPSKASAVDIYLCLAYIFSRYATMSDSPDQNDPPKDVSIKTNAKFKGKSDLVKILYTYSES